MSVNSAKLEDDGNNENASASEEEVSNISEKVDNGEIGDDDDDAESDDKLENLVTFEPKSLFSTTLDDVKKALNAALQKTDDIKEQKSVEHRYKMACIKYKVFPLKKCMKGIDKELLDLSDVNVGPQAIRPVVEALLFSAKITHLIIPGNRLGVKGLKYISYLFSLNSTLVHLNLAGNFIGAQGGKLIQKIIANGYNMEFLDLSHNGLEDQQFQDIVSVLNESSLRELNLSNNKFQDGVGVSLGKCLAANSTLTKLDLGFNKLKAGASGLFLGLRGNSCLRSLNLSGNEISEDSTSDLGKALEANSSIEELDLSYNKLSNESMNHMSKGIKTNNKLKVLNLSFNPIRAQGAQVLINSVSAADNKIEELTLIGIRVNLPFLKTLNGILSSDRKINVEYGNRLRCELCAEHRVDSHEDAPLMQVLKVADSQGLNLKTELQKIHAKFLIDNRAQMELLKAEKAENKEEAEKSEAVAELEQNPRMKVEKFIQNLETCALKVDHELAENLANNFVNEKGTVDIGEIIVKIPLRVDILEFEPEVPKEAEPSKDEAKKKK